MGIIIDSEIETNQGPTNKLYFRIDSWKVNRTVGDITYTTTSWLNKDHGDNFVKNFYDEALRSAIGLVSSRLVYYKSPKSKGKEINIDNLYKIPMYRVVEIDEPVFSIESITKEAPYVSFDENGDEVTLYKTITHQEQIQSGTKKVTKKLMDYSVINRLEEFCYEHLAKELEMYFPKNNIKKV